MKGFFRCAIPAAICILMAGILILPSGTFAENPADHTTAERPVLLWSVPNGKINYASGSMNQIACPGDGSVVVESEAKGVVTARNRNGDLVWSWHAPEPGYQVWSVESSGEGKYTGAILSYPGSSRNEEFVYLDADGNVLWNRTLDKSTWDVSQSEDGKKIAIPGSGNISYFDETGKQLGTTVAGRGPLHTVLSDNGTTIAALVLADSSPCDLLLTGPGGTIAWKVPTDAGNLAISGDGRYISLLEGNRIREFSSDGRELWNYSGSKSFTDVSVSKDGSYIAAGAQDYLRFFTGTGSLLSLYRSTSLASQPYRVSISGNGAYASAATTTDVLFFDRNGTLLWQNPGPSWIYSTCLSSDGRYLGVATQDDFRYYDTGVAPPDATPAAGPKTCADLLAQAAIIAVCALILPRGIKK